MFTTVHPRHTISAHRLVGGCRKRSYSILIPCKRRSFSDNFVDQPLKARPLTTLSSDPNTIEALTLNQFQVGQLYVSFPPRALPRRKSICQRHLDSMVTRLRTNASNGTNAKSGTHPPKMASSSEILYGL